MSTPGSASPNAPVPHDRADDDLVDLIAEEFGSGRDGDSRALAIVRNLGVASWSLIGVILLLVGAVYGLSAISSLVMPLMFAVMIGVVAYPLAERLQRLGWKPQLAAGAVVFGVLIVVVGLVTLVVAVTIDQAAGLADIFDLSLAELESITRHAGIDADQLEQLRGKVGDMSGLIGPGVLTAAVGGLSATVGFIGSSLLGLLIMYYVLCDGPDIKRWFIAQAPAAIRRELDDVTDESTRLVRSYWAGRSILSAVVTAVIAIAGFLLGLPLVPTIAVVNFIGGFVPYFGAFLGGSLGALVALSNGGIGPALTMIAVAVIGNVLLENLLEPKVMSAQLAIHPLVVLMATTAGGVTGGLAGLVLAVPVTAISIKIVGRLKRWYQTGQLGGEAEAAADAAASALPDF